MRRSRIISGMAIIAAVALGAAALPGAARAATVTGLFSYDNGSPAKDRQLHFENSVTHDMFIAPTQPDGTFSADLPPGLYDLRAERGLVLKGKVLVDTYDGTVNVGHVIEPAPLDVRRPFEREGIGEDIVQNPAPSTANMHGRPMEAIRYGGGYKSVQPLGGPAPGVVNGPRQAGGTADAMSPTEPAMAPAAPETAPPTATTTVPAP